MFSSVYLDFVSYLCSLAEILNLLKYHFTYLSMVLIILTSHIRLLLGENGTVRVQLCKFYMHDKCTIELCSCSDRSTKVIVVIIITEIKILIL